MEIIDKVQVYAFKSQFQENSPVLLINDRSK